MSWSFNYIGTHAGVKAKLAADAAAYPSCYPKTLIAFINASIDALAAEYDKSYNGVRVKSSGHGGSVGSLEIQNETVLVDPPVPVAAPISPPA